MPKNQWEQLFLVLDVQDTYRQSGLAHKIDYFDYRDLVKAYRVGSITGMLIIMARNDLQASEVLALLEKGLQ